MKTTAPATARRRAPRKRSAVRAKKPGRPLADEAVVRRQLLLETAVQLFANQGIAATSLHDIAQQARVTPALVHYYFGNKEKLVEAVIDERLVPLMAGLLKPLQTEEGDPLRAIQNLAQWLIDTTDATPWLSALWVREVLSDGGQLRKWIVANMAVPLNDKLGKLVARAQKKGRLNRKLDQRLVIVSLIGLTLFPLACAPIWRAFPGNKTISTQELSRHMLELFANGVEA